jgi:hypothetical protein
LNFIDCPNCDKRVRENAPSCHHCGFELVATQADSIPVEGSAGHAVGGYDSANDDFDYDEFIQEELGSGSSNLPRIWYYTAWLLLLALLIPVLLQVVTLFQGL